MINTLLQAAPGPDGTFIIQSILVIGMIVIAFLIFRAVMLWYWKVDRIVSNQEQQIATMSAILRKLEGWKDEDTNGDSSIMDK